MTKIVPANVEEYKEALANIRPKLPRTYLQMLEAHYLHPDQSITVKELAEAAGYPQTRTANLHYGNLGKRVLKALPGYEPTRRGHNNSPQWTMVIAKGRHEFGTSGPWLWRLRPQVVDALDQLGWFPKSEPLHTPLSDLEEFDDDPATDELRKRNKTQYEALRQSRIGQGDFRNDLLKYWGRKCAVTRVENAALLRASHIKPWRYSDNDERLNKYNGLLLQPNLDAAFDACLISFEDDGRILISKSLSQSDLDRLGIHADMKLSKVDHEHSRYLAYHRDMFYKKNSNG